MVFGEVAGPAVGPFPIVEWCLHWGLLKAGGVVVQREKPTQAAMFLPDALVA